MVQQYVQYHLSERKDGGWGVERTIQSAASLCNHQRCPLISNQAVIPPMKSSHYSSSQKMSPPAWPVSQAQKIKTNPRRNSLSTSEKEHIFLSPMVREAGEKHKCTLWPIKYLYVPLRVNLPK